MKEFVHLHNHSEYSLLDGACRIEDMIDWALKNSAPAIALTDHGNMFGAYEFYSTAKKKGVKPIIGCEVYVAPFDRHDRNKEQRSAYHLTLIAENEIGYKNLMKLVSLGYTEGFYRKPRIDMEILRAYREGVITLTGCINGFVPGLLNDSNDRVGAIKNLERLIDAAGKNNLYVEIQNHYLKSEVDAMPTLIKVAEEFDLPLVGTNDSHYLTKSHHAMHDILLCVQMGNHKNDHDRLRFDNQFYLKSIDEMREVFKDYPDEVISNTMVIADRCDLQLNYDEHIMPQCEVPDGYTNDSYLREICSNGLKERIGGDLSSEIKDRLDYELSVIKETGYAGYLLIVSDYVNYARQQGFPLNARGSAGGSIALYSMGVTTFNPIEYGCIFERFLNLERVNMPDIDIDFAPEHRDLVIQYLIDKYGEESVGYVAAFNSLGAKQAVKDVGRVLEIDLPSVDRLTKQIPSMPGITLDEALEESPQFSKIAAEPQNRDLMQLAKEIEGMKRHVSIHASGIVLSNGPLTDYVPLFKDKNDRVATQFEFNTIEKIGMVKFDFLGLRTLSEIYHCLALIKDRHGRDLKLTDIPLDDTKTFELISKGLVAGLFQLETSPGMKRVVMQIRPDKFEDFIAIPALYRPGPLDSGMMDSFIRRRQGIEPITYLHSTIENALRETYGVCIYQEQVMKIAQDMAGFSLGEADVLRYAMGKKMKDLLIEQREKFIAGCADRNIPEAKAIEVFEYLEPFGRYAFNKSHTAAYSILSYQMAYLKTHYPREFMASMMTGESDHTDKIMKYIAECKLLSDFLGEKINVLPPDVNSSQKSFTIVDDDIRFGLAAVKNVSENAVAEIVAAREKDGSFKSLIDFCERLDSRAVTKRVIESLIYAGAFDMIGDEHRNQYLVSLDRAIKVAQSAQKDRAKGQISLFDGDDDSEDPLTTFTLNPAEPLDQNEKLKMEKDLVGFYLSGHPLDQFTELIDYFTSANSQTILEQPIGSETFVIGQIVELRNITTKHGDAMATAILEDLEGKIPIVIFPDTYQNVKELVTDDNVVWIRGSVGVDNRSQNQNNDEMSGVRQIQVSEMIAINDLIEAKTSAIEVKISVQDLGEKVDQLNDLCAVVDGQMILILRIAVPRYGEIIARCGGKYKIPDTDEILEKIDSIFGENSAHRSNRPERIR